MFKQRKKLSKKCLLRTIEGQQKELYLRDEGEGAVVSYMLERVWSSKGNDKRKLKKEYANILNELYLNFDDGSTAKEILNQKKPKEVKDDESKSE